LINIIIAAEILLFLGACWLGARWRARAVQAALQNQTLLEREQKLLAKLAATIATPPPRTVAPLHPGDRVRTTVALNALSALDATDILLVTRYTLDRASEGSALHEAARRVRAIGERAADNLGIAPHLHGPGAAR